MKKLLTLKELLGHISSAVESGLRQVLETYTAKTVSGKRTEISGWKNMRTVIVGSGNGIRLCARADKQEDEVEILVLKKTCILGGGLTKQDWARVLPKCAIWLEKRNLCYEGKRITDKTPEFKELCAK